jgi:hypothetical protein
MNRFLSIGFALIASCLPVLAQTGQAIKQSGNVTPTHAFCVTTNGIAQDCGTAAIPFLTSIGAVYNGPSICAWSALSTSGAAQEFCLGATNAGGAQITVQNYGTASALPLLLNLNGTIYQFPFSTSGVIGPVSSIVGNFVEWNNATGTLVKDAGFTTGTSGHTIPFLDGTNTWTSAQAIPTIYGGSAANSVLNLYGTSNGSPSGDVINIKALTANLISDKVAGGLNYTAFSNGTGPNGEGNSLSMFYQNLNNSAPVNGQELGFWQVYAWDGTQVAPTGNPIAMVAGASENWTSTHHGSVIFFQAIPNGTANAQNELAIGGGVTALAFGSGGEQQGVGQGTFNAQNVAGYYINGAQVLSKNGNYTLLASPANQTDAANILLGNASDANIYGRVANQLVLQDSTTDVQFLALGKTEITPTDATIALGDATHRFTTGNFSGAITSNITGGGTQCVQSTNSGVLSGTGTGCPGTVVYLCTITASNSASLNNASPTSGSCPINGTYTSYELVFQNLVPATNEKIMELQIHSGGAYKATGYITNESLIIGGSPAGNNSITTYIPITYPTDANGDAIANTAPGFSGKLFITNPSVSGLIMISGDGAYLNGSGQLVNAFCSGYWNTAGVVDGFQVLMDSGNITSGSILVYGIQ